MSSRFDVFVSAVLPILPRTHALTLEFLSRNSQQAEEVILSYDAYYTLLALPNGLRFNDRAYYPYNYPYFEALEELQSSIALAFSGFYKGAIQHLRFYLEMVVLGHYFCQPLDEARVQEWLIGDGRTPGFLTMLRDIKSEPLNTYFNNVTSIDLEQECYSVYDRLSGFVHTRGGSVGGRTLRGTTEAIFSPDAFMQWTKHLHNVTRAVGLTFAARFPICLQELPVVSRTGFAYQPRGGYLEPHEAQLVRRVFDEQELPILQQFSDGYYVNNMAIDKDKLNKGSVLTREQLEATWNDYQKIYKLGDRGDIPDKTYYIDVLNPDSLGEETTFARVEAAEDVAQIGHSIKRQLDILDEEMLADAYIRKLYEDNGRSL